MFRGKPNQHRPNPRETTNFISTLFFLYLLPVFKESYKSGFTEKDLFQTLKADESNDLTDVLESNWRKASKKHKKWSLHLALLKTHSINFTLAGIALFFKEFQRIAFIPFAIGKLVSYFAQTNKIAASEAYFYAGVIIICLSMERVITHPVMFWLQHIAMRMRVACCGLMYRKILRFKKSAMHQISLGQVVILMSNDVSRFESGFKCLHFIWIAPVQTMLAMYYMYVQFGSTCLLGVGFFLVLIPLQLYAAKKSAHFRLNTARNSDLRVKLMNEILQGIQVIKMFTWEKPFANLVEEARRNEIKNSRFQKLLWAFTHFELYLPRTVMFLTLLFLYLNGEMMSAEMVFSMIAVYDVINHTLSSLFEGIRMGADANVSLLRINEFLHLDEVYANIGTKSVQKIQNNVDKIKERPTILLNKISAKWPTGSTNSTLSNISLQISGPQLFAIIGPVGSGKSSLLHVLLEELPIIKGNLCIKGKISYYSQETWIFSGSIRQNILFGDQYDERRYKNVCQVCALKTDFHHFAHGDETLIGENGKTLSGGQKARVALARCIYKQADIYLLDDPLSAVDTAVGQQLFYECIKTFLGDKICILITHQLQFLAQADKILNEGTTQGYGTYHELQSSGLDFAQLLGEAQNDKNESYNKKYHKQPSKSDIRIDEIKSSQQQNQKKSKLLTEAVSKSIYRQYFLAGTSYFQLIFLFISFILFHLTARGANYFLSYLVETQNSIDSSDITIKEKEERQLELMYQYAIIIFATIVLAIFHKAYFFIILSRSAMQLHKTIFSTLLNAKMHFFNTTPIGRILNRFSKDMGVVDDYLPSVMYFLYNSAMYLIGIIILTSIMRPFLLIPALLLMCLFYNLRYFYIRCNTNVKRIEGSRRSPLFTHISATFAGLSTIRALDMQHTLIQEFHYYQNEHSTALWQSLASGRAFGMWLDLFCCIFITIVILLLITFTNDMNGGELGLIITQYMGLMGSIQFGMRQWSEMETNMISVERVLEYTQLDNETDRRNHQALPKDWPDKGKLEFKSISMKYNEDDPPVLKRISFIANPSEKIGIVGRTGAGKSSIITALFQLYKTSGSILIDDVDVTKISLHDLRSKISIIPQNPILFEGSLRKNLDPFDQYTNDLLWNALDQVKLNEFVNKMPRKLETGIAEGGINFSVGQRQLICLARAILRRNKILVLDEATANVDPYTDKLIQETIRKVFVDCTVLTIAHRLHTVMDGDKILVMDAGQVVEFGTPYQLLQNRDGKLKMMLEKTGTDYSNDLIKIAEKVHVGTQISSTSEKIRQRKPNIA